MYLPIHTKFVFIPVCCSFASAYASFYLNLRNLYVNSFIEGKKSSGIVLVCVYHMGWTTKHNKKQCLHVFLLYTWIPCCKNCCLGPCIIWSGCSLCIEWIRRSPLHIASPRCHQCVEMPSYISMPPLNRRHH